MIVDTSVLIAVLRRESDYQVLRDRLVNESDVRISAGTLLEARMVAERQGGSLELQELLDVVGARVVPVDAELEHLAFEGFRRYGKGRHRASLNFGDLFAYALARATEQPLLFKGGDFARTDVKVA